MLEAHRQRRRASGVLAACQFRPVLLFGAVDRARGRPQRQAQAADHRAVVRHAAVVRAGGTRVHAPRRRWSPSTSSRSVGGFATAFDNPARRAFVVEMVPDDQVQNAVSLNSALMTGSRIVGPALAGLLIGTVGFGWCFLVDGISLHRRHRRAVDDADRPSCDRSVPTPESQGPGPRRSALRPHGARAVGAAGDDGDRRHVRLQLPGR